MEMLKQAQLDAAAEILKKCGVIAFPTETVYGLGVIYDNKEAYDKLVQVKRRPPEKPFTMMLADIDEVEKYAKLNKVSRALVKAFMPGQFTLLAEAQPGLPKWCVSETGTVGIRIADYNLIRDLIRKTGKPLLVPSANKSGEAPATTSAEVNATLGSELDAIIEGASVSNTPSTIVLVQGEEIHVIRAGVITLDQINKVIKEATK